jgi:type IV secretory pathway TraG/TraD family ATPase VirD4
VSDNNVLNEAVFSRALTLVGYALCALAVAGVLYYLGRRQWKTRAHALAAAPELLLTSGWVDRWTRRPVVAPELTGGVAWLRWSAWALAGMSFLLGVSAVWAVGMIGPNGTGVLLGVVAIYSLMGALCLLVPIGLLVLLIWALSSGGSGRRGDRTHGTARWHPLRREWWNPQEAAAAALVIRPENGKSMEGLTPWTIKDATFAHFTWSQLSRHMLVVGATGSGKTTTIYHHLMVSARMPWIYQDQKGDLPLRDRFPDRPVWGLDTRGFRSRSGIWNPMEEVRGPEDIEVMSALLFPDRGNMNDWVARGARMLFEAMCKRWHFESLQQYVYLLEHVPLDRLIEELPAGYGTALADTRTRANFMSEILDVLRPWINTSRIAAVTYGRSTVTLDDFIERGGYVVCNEDKHLRQPVTLFWGMLLHRLRNRPTGETHPLLLLMDEFGDAGKIPNMAQALALYRSKGVGIIAGIQSMALLESVYGETEWRAIRDGFGTQIIMTANMTPQLQMEMTQQLGTYTMEHAQSSTSVGGLYPSVSASVSSPTRTAAALVPVDQWAYWSANRAVIVRGATGPTWWIPWPVELPSTPVGTRLLADPEADWRMHERERIAIFGEGVRSLLESPRRDLAPVPPLRHESPTNADAGRTLDGRD